MTKLSKGISNWLYRQGAIEKDEIDLYEYAVYCFIITIAPLIMALLCSAMIGGIKQCISILIPFMLLRQYSGGYHAKNVWFCMISSFLTIIILVWIAMNDIGGIVHWSLLAVSVIVIIKSSPIESDNRKLDEKEKVEYHKKAKIILFVFLMLEIILNVIGLTIYANSIGIGIIMVAFSQVLYFIKYN